MCAQAAVAHDIGYLLDFVHDQVSGLGPLVCAHAREMAIYYMSLADKVTGLTHDGTIVLLERYRAERDSDPAAPPVQG